MQQTKSEQEKLGKPMQIKKKGPLTYKSNYVDMYVQNDVRWTIHETNSEEVETKIKCRK